ncbi:MAG: MaoC family dehydratase [Bdellovibrionaceae bacterium]|nr:MaoC family dehydratase [Pseudobdellovibrionaceae bacterium]
MSDLHGFYLEDLSVGMTATYTRTITQTEIILFAGISGDDNPVHINEVFAKATPFKGRIAHGILTSGLVSTVLGTRLPGPGAILLSLNAKFKAPVRADDTVAAKVTVKEIDLERKCVFFTSQCTVGETVVLEGEARVKVDSRR